MFSPIASNDQNDSLKSRPEDKLEIYDGQDPSSLLSDYVEEVNGLGLSSLVNRFNDKNAKIMTVNHDMMANYAIPTLWKEVAKIDSEIDMLKRELGLLRDIMERTEQSSEIWAEEFGFEKIKNFAKMVGKDAYSYSALIKSKEDQKITILDKLGLKDILTSTKNKNQFIQINNFDNDKKSTKATFKKMNPQV